MQVRLVAALILAITVSSLNAATAFAAISVQWTFETGTTNNPPMASGTDITDLGTAVGTGTASGHHSSSDTIWDNPVGNGTPESLSSNHWSVGDYYQFHVSTLGSQAIQLAFSAISSSTGPRDFSIFYSTDGSTFTDTALGYSLNWTPNWLSGTFQSAYAYSFDLSSISALNNSADLYLRLVNDSSVSASIGGNDSTGFPSSGVVGPNGTSRLDDVTISGVNYVPPTAVPEPLSAVVWGVLLIGGGYCIKRYN